MYNQAKIKTAVFFFNVFCYGHGGHALGFPCVHI